MKKKILSIILLLIVMIGVTGCGSNKKLNELAKKINDSDSVKTYNKSGYEIKATTTKDTLTITSKMGDNKSKVDFKLKDDILSNENISNNDLIAMMIVINGVGQTYGYKDGEMTQNMNAFPEKYQQYTLEKDGIEIIMNAEKMSLKIDLSKKVPLVDMNDFYLKAEDLDMISDLVSRKESGNQSGKLGNIAYDVFVAEDESTIQIGQDGKLSDSAYKSILSALEVIYGKDTANHFQELYPKFEEGKKTVEAFTIEKNYKMEDQDESAFKDTEIVLVTIDNKKVK